MDWETDVQPILTSMVRHGLTLASGVLAADGWIQHDQATQFVAIGSAVCLYGLSQAWSIWQKRQQKAATEVAASTGNPTP